MSARTSTCEREGLCQLGHSDRQSTSKLDIVIGRFHARLPGRSERIFSRFRRGISTGAGRGG
eukprot:2550275-Pyramimonas_sp.AAC.1